MQPVSRSPFPLLTWLLAGALMLSLGANLYWLTPHYRSQRPTAAAEAALRAAWDDDDDDEEDDASWVALTEELRQTRHQLAECQSQPLTANRTPPRR